jgi:Fe-S cluster biogenesis protein NfuA
LRDFKYFFILIKEIKKNKCIKYFETFTIFAKKKIMQVVNIIPTKSESIVKFEVEQQLVQNQNFEFKNIDEAKPSPLAQKLFYLPFVKTVYISFNYIAVEKYSIVEWEDIQDDVAELIKNYIETGEKVVKEEVSNKKIPISIYAETTPNPETIKFVANKRLTSKVAHYTNIDETESSKLAKELFQFSAVKEVFIDENYVSITKYKTFEWIEISNEIRSFIKEFCEQNERVIDEEKIVSKIKIEAKQEERNMDVTSQKIVSIIDEYIKPAVQQDGGNIVFESYNPETYEVKVLMQGACNGCPSSQFTLKNGMESLLRDMLENDKIVVRN